MDKKVCTKKNVSIEPMTIHDSILNIESIPSRFEIRGMLW